MFSGDDQRPMNSQFAVRVAVLGGVALLVFTAIFFRLWYLEVLSGDEYLVQAQNNRTRSFPIQAARGQILDRNGKVLVENRTAPSLQVRPDELPRRKRERDQLIGELSDLANMPVKRINREIREQTALLPASPVTLKRDVDPNLVYHLSEREDQFPGVTADEVTVRKYPNDKLASHLFGYVSEIGEEQLELPQYDELDPGDRIGAAGLELQYDSALRGRNGAVEVPVDTFGEPRGRSISEVPPERGNDLVTTLDAKVQKAGEEAIGQFGLPASFVVMNVNDGAVLGMGSLPNFDPSIYTPPVSFDKLEQLTDAPDDPLFNKAIQSGYPTGSTFKLVTSTAGLEEGLISPTDVIQDSGSFEFGGRSWINAGSVANGPVALVKALQVSSDIYYYRLGMQAEDARVDGGSNAFEKWASRLGFGQTTGIDIPGEQPGILPTPEWRNELFEEGLTDREWSTGDMMNLAVGQGDLSATPLQLALAYSTVANGGRVVRPHLAQKVENPLGQAQQEFDPAAQRQLDISEETRAGIMEGLRRAAMEPGGTSYGVFGDSFPVEIAGKTGTAEKTDQEDQSWYAAVAPFDDPQVVVVVTVERGGFGSDSAAPAARQILERYATDYLEVKPKQFEAAPATTTDGAAVGSD